MKNIMFCNIIYLLISWTIVASCNLSSNKKKDGTVHIFQDTLALPTSETCDSNKFESYNWEIKQLGLDDLRNGFNGQQIRFWLEYGLSDSFRVVVFKNQNEKWTAEAYYCKYILNKEYKPESLQLRVQNSTPLSGWDNFLNGLNNIQFYELIDYCKIKDFYDCTGGDGIITEVVSSGIYRVFRLPCFDVYDEKLPEFIRFKKILMFIQGEFDFKLFPGPEIKRP